MNEMGPSLECKMPAILVEFVEHYEASGAILCQSPPEDVASSFRNYFCIPTPVSSHDADELIEKLANHITFYLQPGLERQKHIRGFWFAFEGFHAVLIDPDRPDPSKIKTVIHELGEKLLAISYQRHPRSPRFGVRDRESWANKMGAFLKMPSKLFKERVQTFGVDLEMLKDHFDDTLAGVARHVRDLVVSERPFYFCRFDIETDAETRCPSLLETIERTGGYCVRVVDVVRTASMRIERRQGGPLPSHNLPSTDHYRILHPSLNKYIETNKALFIELMVGGTSDKHRWDDLLNEQNLAVLLVPYGEKETASGFFLVAVHPRERYLLDFAVERLVPETRGRIDWLFSWANHTAKRCPPDDKQPELKALGDDPLNLFNLPKEAYRWAKPKRSLIEDVLQHPPTHID